MMSMRKLSCPSCGAALKIPATMAEGKMIKCPKCALGFPVPEEEPATPAYEPDEELEERPRKKFRKKKPTSSSKAPLIVGLVMLCVILLGGGAAIAFALSYVHSSKKTPAMAENNAARTEADRAPTTLTAESGSQPKVDGGASRPKPSPGSNALPPTGGSGAESAAPSPAPSSGPAGRPTDQAPPARQAAGPTGNSSSGATAGGGATGSDEFAAAKRVFAQNCSRCHSVGEDASAGGMGRKRDLSGVGAAHDVDYFMRFIRNPAATKRGSRGMPAFDGRLSQADIRAVAQYLASLK